MRNNFLLGVILSLSFGCTSNKSPEVRPQKGVEQGNGIIHYSNEIMGIEFDVPERWTLVENPERTSVKLNNSQIALPDFVTEISFSYSSILDNMRFENSKDLGEYIRKTRSQYEWSNVRLLNYEGVVRKTRVGFSESADYFVIGREKFILSISYHSNTDANGDKIVSEIMKTLVLDDEPPVFQEIYFDKAEVKPGEKVKLYVRVVDALSGVQVETMGRKFREQDGRNWDLETWRGTLGYRMTVPDDLKSPSYDLVAQALPFVDNFTYLGDDLYVYEFQIPRFAPLGEIVANTIEASDYFGNKARITLFSPDQKRLLDKYDLYATGEKSNLPTQIEAAKFQVIDPHVEGYIEDREAPKFKDIYFDKAVIDISNPEINMFFEIDDVSELAKTWDWWGREAKFPMPRLDENCSSQRSPLKMVGPNLYRVRVSFEMCTTAWSSSQQNKIIVKPTMLHIRDELGMDTTQRDFSKFPRAQFYVRIR